MNGLDKIFAQYGARSMFRFNVLDHMSAPRLKPYQLAHDAAAMAANQGAPLSSLNLYATPQHFAEAIATGYGPWEEMTADKYTILTLLLPTRDWYDTGFAKIFENMRSDLARQGCRFMGTNIAAVLPNKTVIDKSGATTGYDSIIISCDPRRLQSPYSWLVPHLIHTNFFAAIVKTNSVPPAAPVIHTFDDIGGPVVSALAYPNKQYLYVSGYFDPNDAAQLATKIEQQMSKQFGPSSVRYIKPIEYNLRYSRAARSAGIPERLKRLNGRNDIWFATGTLLSRWNVIGSYFAAKSVAKKV